MGTVFVRLAGTVSVLIVVAFIIGGSDILIRLHEKRHSWKSMIVFGLAGGVFGIYGNLAGMTINGAVVSVRDIGPMMAGMMSGPAAGLIAGIISGAHRLYLGGITAQACIVATCLIGVICGLLSMVFKDKVLQPKWAYVIGMVMESMHLCIVMIMVRPISTAWGIVSEIAIPFIVINGAGIGILMIIIRRIAEHRVAEAERNRLKSELELAARIQQSQLPLITDKFPGRDEISLAASMQPAKEVGGDFYDFFFLDPDHFAMVIADVSGKGIPAALFMIRSKQTIHTCVHDEPDLAKAIIKANDSLCENNEEELFVTAWVGVLEISTGSLRYVSAGHNPPVLVAGRQAVYIKGRSGLVLGGMEGARYKEGTMEVMPGNKLFLYTDGVTEAENESHDQYGEKKLQNCLKEAAGQTVDQVLETVKADIVKHAAGADQFDDMTMICLELKG